MTLVRPTNGKKEPIITQSSAFDDNFDTPSTFVQTFTWLSCALPPSVQLSISRPKISRALFFRIEKCLRRTAYAYTIKLTRASHSQVNKLVSPQWGQSCACEFDCFSNSVTWINPLSRNRQKLIQLLALHLNQNGTPLRSHVSYTPVCWKPKVHTVAIFKESLNYSCQKNSVQNTSWYRKGTFSSPFERLNGIK